MQKGVVVRFLSAKKRRKQLVKRVVFSIIVAVLFSAKTEATIEQIPSEISQADYDTIASNLIRFSKPIDDVLDDDISETLTECDVREVRVISLESILNAVLPGQPAYIDYYRRMLDDQALFEKTIEDFLYSKKAAFVLSPPWCWHGEVICRDRESPLHKYITDIQNLITDTYKCSQKYRKCLVAFLVALEWRRKIDPEFRIAFRCNHYNSMQPSKMGESKCLQLNLTVNCERSSSYYVLPPEGKTPLRNPFDNYYSLTHEIGHATHYLLGIDMDGVPFSRVSSNQLMERIFFSPLISVEEKLDECIATTRVASYLNKYEQELEKKVTNPIYERIVMLYLGEATRKVSAFSRPFSLGDKPSADGVSLQDLESLHRYLQNLVKFAAKDVSFGYWSTPEEILQIGGMTAVANHIFVNLLSDFDMLVDQKRRVRWFHISEPICCGLGDLVPGLPLFPEAKFLQILFALHGIRYEEYLSLVTDESETIAGTNKETPTS